TALPLRVMVRSDNGFELDPRALPELRRQARALADAGVDGLVVGFARAGTLALDDLVRTIEGCSARVTFHRAFDTLADPLAAIDALCGIAAVDRILTSGGDGPALGRCGRLQEYAARAGSRLRIIAGGGIDEAMLTHLGRTGWTGDVHVGRAARDGDPGGS